MDKKFEEFLGDLELVGGLEKARELDDGVLVYCEEKMYPWFLASCVVTEYEVKKRNRFDILSYTRNAVYKAANALFSEQEEFFIKFIKDNHKNFIKFFRVQVCSRVKADCEKWFFEHLKRQKRMKIAEMYFEDAEWLVKEKPEWLKNKMEQILQEYDYHCMYNDD